MPTAVGDVFELTNTRKESRKALPCHRLILFVLTCAFWGYGCATMRLPDYPALPIDRYPYKYADNEFAVAIHPILDESESKRYFGKDLLADDILAVFLLMENRSATSSFRVEKRSFSVRGLKLGEDLEKGDITSQDAERWTSIMVLSTAGGLSLTTGLLGLAKMEADSLEIHTNFRSKELHTTTLSPGEQAQGFVYFRVPKGAKSMAPWSIQFEAKRPRLDDPKEIDIPFNWSAK